MLRSQPKVNGQVFILIVVEAMGTRRKRKVLVSGVRLKRFRRLIAVITIPLDLSMQEVAKLLKFEELLLIGLIVEGSEDEIFMEPILMLRYFEGSRMLELLRSWTVGHEPHVAEENV